MGSFAGWLKHSLPDFTVVTQTVADFLAANLCTDILRFCFGSLVMR
jgi:hypothetical protein